MKKTLTVALLLIMAFALSSCKQQTIKIGFVNSLAHNFGNLGIDSMYGAIMAVDEINENGGINGKEVELIIRDDERDIDRAVVVDNELKDLGVVGIIGHGYSLTATATAANASKNDILLITPTVATEEITGIADNYFRVTPSTKEQGISLANMAYNENPGDFVIIYESVNSAFSLNLVDSFIEQYESLGMSIDEDNIIPFRKNSLEDYLEVKQELESRNIENVLAVGSSFDVGNIIQILDDSSQFTFYLPAWTTTSDIFEFASNKVNNSYAINFFDFEYPNTRLKNFMNDYKDQYGREASYTTILAYEAIYLLKETLEQTDDYSVENLRKIIVETREYQGIMNNYYIDEYGECFRRIYHYKLVNGTFHTIGFDDYD